jgi:DNA-binding transcriptional regulator YbjK
VDNGSPRRSTGKRAGRPGDETRLTRIVDAAIRILAEEGARGLSHRAIDRLCQLPDGATSNFFKSRHDILTAACERIVDLDLADLARLRAAAVPSRDLPDELRRIAAMLIAMMAPQNQNRARARLELYLAATRNPAIMRIFTSRWQHEFVDFSEREIMAFVPRASRRTMETYRALLTGLLTRSAFESGGMKDPQEVISIMTELMPLFDRPGNA